jgi:hypothetical protein
MMNLFLSILVGRQMAEPKFFMIVLAVRKYRVLSFQFDLKDIHIYLLIKTSQLGEQYVIFWLRVSVPTIT